MDCRHRSHWVSRCIKRLFGQRIAVGIDHPQMCARYADANADKARSLCTQS
jgi:hypothetical protein